eukprot:s664_g18.t1
MRPWLIQARRKYDSGMANKSTCPRYKKTSMKRAHPAQKEPRPEKAQNPRNKQTPDRSDAETKPAEPKAPRSEQTKLLVEIHNILKQLPRDVRRDVITKQLSQEQRLILEKWMVDTSSAQGICFDAVEIRTKACDLQTGLEYLLVLTAVNQKMRNSQTLDVCFEESLQKALVSSAEEHGKDLAELELHSRTIHSAHSFIGPGTQLRTPKVRPVEELEKMRRLLEPFCNYAKTAGTVNHFWQYSPVYLQDAWERFRKAVAEVLQHLYALVVERPLPAFPGLPEAFNDLSLMTFPPQSADVAKKVPKRASAMLCRSLLPCKAWSSRLRCSLRPTALFPRVLNARFASEVREVSQEKAFEVVKVEGHGLSARATRDLKLGDVVLLEEPVLVVTSNDKGDEWKEQLYSQYQALPEEKQQEVWNLHDACLQKPEKSLEGILFTNCIGRDQRVRFDAALCLELSRFNHSCSPNLEQSWDQDAGQVRLVAAEPVKAGEELFTHYVELRLHREERRQQLLENYGFWCECKACSNWSEESDRRRTEMKRLDDSIRVDQQDRLKNMDRGERSVKRVLKLFDQEGGLHLLAWRKLHCLSGMEFALRKGDVPASIRWARKGYENAKLAHGEHHRDTMYLAALMKDPSSHPDFEYRTESAKNWGTWVVAMCVLFVILTVAYV